MKFLKNWPRGGGASLASHLLGSADGFSGQKAETAQSHNYAKDEALTVQIEDSDPAWTVAIYCIQPLNLS